MAEEGEEGRVVALTERALTSTSIGPPVPRMSFQALVRTTKLVQKGTATAARRRLRQRRSGTSASGTRKNMPRTAQVGRACSQDVTASRVIRPGFPRRAESRRAKAARLP